MADGARSWIAHEKQGLHGGGNSLILTVTYAGTRTETIFVKRNTDPARREADRYAFLAERGFPVARLLSTVQRDGAEIVVLEFLPKIGIEAAAADLLLRLLADLNTIDPFPADVFTLPPGMPAAQFDAGVEQALRNAAEIEPIDPAAYFRRYQRIDFAGLPLALNHGEFGFQQLGWSSGRRLVFFDLETMGARPRFTDIAAILPGLAALTGRGERELFDTYLGGRPDPEAWRELRRTRAAMTFQSLPWLVRVAGRRHVVAALRRLAGDLAAHGLAGNN